ncbi:MAG: peptide-methionine (S)-S-oxide reductase MsrA, partial [Robiginitomaculum sp.]|nr:peptide-methionine (S)-S-oxide reductase MsrA [Robiginitomaculum sp.]
PDVIPYTELLKTFFENHDPTQGDRQGNDLGSQYRSMIYTYSDAQNIAATTAKARYNEAYAKADKNPITTGIETAPTYYPAEDYHQQYLAKNPDGYCNIGGTGVSCPAPSA